MLILEAVAAARQGLFLGEIADAVNLPKATASRLVAGLVKMQLLSAGGGGRKIFALGPRFAQLLHTTLHGPELEVIAHPALRELVAQFQETAFLTRLLGLDVLSVAIAIPDRDWRGHVQPGRIMAPHAAASAKAILAFQPASLVERILAAPLPRFTSYTRTDPEEVHAEYARVRDKGYATCVQEIDLGLIGYACPVRLADAGTLYSVGVIGPMDRLCPSSPEEIVSALQRAAQRLAIALERSVGTNRRAVLPPSAE